MSASEHAQAVELYERHHAELWRYLVRFTGDADLAADLVQETFVRLLRSPPRAAHRVWLFRVATNLARDAARARTRRGVLMLNGAARLPHGDAPLQPDDLLERKEMRGRVHDALLSLSEKERTALLMSEEGFLQREIADALGTTTGSVGSLIARAARKLEAQLPAIEEGIDP